MIAASATITPSCPAVRPNPSATTATFGGRLPGGQERHEDGRRDQREEGVEPEDDDGPQDDRESEQKNRERRHRLRGGGHGDKMIV